MTLINKILTELEDPKNREIVNGGQNYFDVDISDNLILFYSLPIEELSEIELFFIIRHCINLLPCFDMENPEYAHRQCHINEYEEWLEASADQEILSTDDIDMLMGRNQLIGINSQTPKTIRQALLCSGAMTVEELEQEYLKLIK